jgi:hypothetical protein
MTHSESLGVQDQTDEAFAAVYENCDHRMVSIKTGSEMVPWVERCQDCGLIDPRALEQVGHQIVKKSLSERASRIAVATETEPFAFVQSVHEELDLPEVLGQALGAASVCWEERALFGAGTFDESRARAILIALTREVERFQKLALEDAATRVLGFIHARSGVVPEKELPALRRAIEEE